MFCGQVVSGPRLGSILQEDEDLAEESRQIQDKILSLQADIQRRLSGAPVDFRPTQFQNLQPAPQPAPQQPLQPLPPPPPVPQELDKRQTDGEFTIVTYTLHNIL